MINSANQLYKASDLLRGSLELRSQKRVIFTILTVSQLEQNSSEYTIPSEAKWSYVILQGSPFKENLMNALFQIERENPDLEGVLLTKDLEDIEEDILQRLVSLINQVEVTPQLIEEVLYHFSVNEGKLGGEFMTPPPVSKLMSLLLNIKGGTIYDGTAGVAQLLIEVGGRASKSGNDYYLFGQEINPDTWAIGKMNLVMHGMKHEFALGNTLSNPAYLEGSQLKRFDYVIMNFPFSVKGWGRDKAEYDLYKRFPYGIPSESNADLAFVQQGLSSLDEEGKAAFVVTHGTLFRGGAERKIREAMIKDDVIEAVIGLPPNLFPTTAIPVAILILNKNKSSDRKGVIQFINAEDLYEKMRGQNKLRDEDIEKIQKAYHQKKVVKQFSILVSIDEIEDANLHFGPYFEVDEVESIFGKVQVNRREYEKSLSEHVELRGLVDPFRGMNTPSKKDLEKQTGDYHFIQLADVQEGNILFDQLIPVNVDSKKARTYEVEKGDIIISSRGAAIKVAVIPSSDKKLILSHNFIGLRPRRGVNPYFIKAFLESPIGTYYISSKQKGTAVTVLSVKDIETIPVPALDQEIQDEIGKYFVRADEELINTIKAAKEKHKQDYSKLYKKMDINRAFKTISTR